MNGKIIKRVTSLVLICNIVIMSNVWCFAQEDKTEMQATIISNNANSSGAGVQAEEALLGDNIEEAKEATAVTLSKDKKSSNKSSTEIKITEPKNKNTIGKKIGNCVVSCLKFTGKVLAGLVICVGVLTGAGYLCKKFLFDNGKYLETDWGKGLHNNIIQPITKILHDPEGAMGRAVVDEVGNRVGKIFKR